MIKRSSKYYLSRGLVFLIVGLMFILGYGVTTSLQNKKTSDENIRYVSYEILTDNVMPVINQTPQPDTTVMKPYTDGSVTIGKSYYDPKAEEQNQEDSIIYYENTYIQNTGVDYTCKNVFEVNAIADGTVISITKDDVVGETIKIEHNNDLIGIYQSVKEVQVKENDQVTKGQVIAKSGTNGIGSDLGNHLHFELYQNNNLINPEEYFANNQGN